MSKTVLGLLFCQFILLGLISCDDYMIDMTYPLQPATFHLPKRPPFTLKSLNLYGNVPWTENEYSSAEHLGTHMDAPVHFVAGKWFLDEIPVENFVGPAVVIDITDKAAKDKDAYMTVDDLEAWEEKHGRIPDGSILLVNSGWGKFWGNKTLFFGNDTNDLRYLHCPGIHKDAAQWIVDNRNIKGVGIDTFSFDIGSAKNFPAHEILLGKNIFGLEMVANIDKLPPKGATLYVLPMKIVNGTGGATRILAIENGVSAGNNCFPQRFFIVLLISLAYFLFH